MAGGKGERFWPKSRERLPKQFLKLIDNEKTMLQLTVERILPAVKKENIYIITNVIYKEIIYEQLPYISAENIIFEPIAKNTAPAIGLGAIWATQKYEDVLMAVLPSDHMIYPEDTFIKELNKCFETAEQGENIVTIGIRPSYPETGYGYIRYEDRESVISRVCKFTEKPSIDIARKYISEGSYLWNSGIFVWKISTILKIYTRFYRKFMKD
jgi:mannose-1-phosphate guanylyltransferase